MLCWAACFPKKEQKKEAPAQLIADAPAEVSVEKLRLRTFTSEVVSSGRTAAGNVAELRFRSSEEPIALIRVKNGQQVSKGAIIAELQPFAFENKCRQAKEELERSRLEWQDMLIGQGYKLKDTADISGEAMRTLMVKSGYGRAQSQYAAALYDKEKAILRAPLSGVVANLKSKAHMLPNISEPFCNIVDMHSMQVSFSVLENELAFIKMGGKVKIVPYALPEASLSGNIIEINPWVDKNGMVQMKASVAYHEKLLEGMNVKVRIFRSWERQWVVSKTAVVLRTDRQVVFVYKAGKAQWHYVKTGRENAAEYTISSETLREGDEIIITGNVHLADQSPVKLAQP